MIDHLLSSRRALRKCLLPVPLVLLRGASSQESGLVVQFDEAAHAEATESVAALVVVALFGLRPWAVEAGRTAPSPCPSSSSRNPIPSSP